MSVRPASHFLTRSPGGFRADFSAPKGRGLWRRRPRCRSAIGPTRLHESVDQLVIFRSHSMLCPDRSTSSAWRRDCAPPPHLHNSKKSSSRQSVELFSLTNPPPSPSPPSVKYEEVEQDVPSLPKLRKCASNVYSCEIIKKMELAGASPVPAPAPPLWPLTKNLFKKTDHPARADHSPPTPTLSPIQCS